MAENTIAGLQPQRLSDDEPMDYVPKEHVVTGRAVDSRRETPAAVPALEGRAAEILAAELLVFAQRAARAGTIGNPLETALLRAAQLLIDELRQLIDDAIEPSGSAQTGSTKSVGRRGRKRAQQ